MLAMRPVSNVQFPAMRLVHAPACFCTR